jgi:hypothetical protein
MCKPDDFDLNGSIPISFNATWRIAQRPRAKIGINMLIDRGRIHGKMGIGPVGRKSVERGLDSAPFSRVMHDLKGPTDVRTRSPSYGLLHCEWTGGHSAPQNCEPDQS